MKSNVIPLIPNTTETISLTSSAGISDVESLMNALAQGSRFEFAGQMVKEHLSTGGKRIRARLALSSSAALGSSRSVSIPWAAAVELLHNATLIHDDIQDGDEVRRGQPTTWVRHGQAQAINAGDLLLMLPFLALSQLQTSDSVRWQLSWRLADQAASIVRGQVEEMTLLEKEDLSFESYIRAVNGKTSGLFSLPVEGSALLSGHSSESARRIGEAFIGLGTLFQLQDDVLDLYGHKGRQMAGMDICEGKVSALVVRHVEAKPDQREALLAILKLPREKTTPAHIADMSQAFKDSGALDWVLDDIHQLNQAVQSDKYLHRHPQLFALAQELCNVALKPIQFMF
ncbi:MAG: polyprenyl synthetase family protein [Myxococcota bacterium]